MSYWSDGSGGTEVSVRKAGLEDMIGLGSVSVRSRRMTAATILNAGSCRPATGQLLRVSRELDFSRPGKPADIANIEAFSSRLRQECLNASWFLSMPDARYRINNWRIDCNENRPYSAVGNLTANAFAAQLKPARKVA